MAEISVSTIAGAAKTLGDDALSDIRARVRGEVVVPADSGYDDTRQI